jgi:hypothetical protein
MLDKRIRRATEQREKLYKNAPYWMKEMLTPLAGVIEHHLPGFEGHLLGPFGISCEASIHFYRKGVPEKERFNEGNCYSITFCPGKLEEGELFIRDRTVDTGFYRKGTIGEMNGMNHPNHPFLWTEENLMEWFRKQNPEWVP